MCAVAPPGPAVSNARSRLELADIVRTHGEEYRRTHRLARVQDRALRAIATCRTAVLGGHRETCDRCGAVRLTYNSCRNRHCPKCQTLDQARWLAARKADLLPIPYFHVVFTLPHTLNALAQGNPRVIYTLLFRAAAETLLAFGRDPRHLGGTLGITAILHTWGQNLSQHLHLHCVVTGGALSPDRARWIPARPRFLFPVRALATVFRGKYVAALRDTFRAGQLTFAAGTAALADAPAFDAFLHDLYRHPWIVYSKRPFGGPDQALAYLGRYTHRVAIANHRLLTVDGHMVRFQWRDYADHNRTKVMALAAPEFLRRFLLHVLPDRFVRIRHFGLLANHGRRQALDRCRTLLHQPAPTRAAAPESAETLMLRVIGLDLRRCPFCGEGRLHVTAIVPPTAPVWPNNTS